LTAAVADKVRGRNIHFRIRISQADGKLLSFLRANAQRLDEQYNEDAVDIEATLGKNQFVPVPKTRRAGISKML